MALSEDEEFELLSLERERAMRGPTDPYGRPIARAESIREEYPSETFARYAEPISQFGGMFAKTPGMGGAIAGATTMGAEIAKQGIQALGSEPGTPQTVAESGRRIASAFGRGAGGELLGRGILSGASKLVPSAETTGQLVRVATGVPQREATAVIKDPSILSRAKSGVEAGKQYQKALQTAEGGQLLSAGKGSRAAFGKTMLSPEATINKFDDLLPSLESGELDLQSALALRQTASHHLGKAKGDWYDAPMREVLERADAYLESKLSQFPEAVKAYREAKIAEEFGSWLPLNKNLSPNVLRTAGALTYAAHGAAEGNVVPSIMALGVSPKVWGYGIRAGATAAPVVKGGAQIGSRLAGQSIAGQALPSSTQTADEIKAAYKRGDLSREQAAQMLRTNYGNRFK